MYNLRKMEKERVRIAKLIAEPYNLKCRVISGGNHLILRIEHRKIPIPNSSSGPKWETAIKGIVSELRSM